MGRLGPLTDIESGLSKLMLLLKWKLD